MTNVSAIVIHEFGNPADVVRIETRELPEPKAGEAVVKMIAAPINPADLNLIEGTYPVRPELPAVAGNEGVGEVIALGPGVQTPALGSHVLVPHGIGTWCQACIAPAERLVEIPRDIDVEQAAMLMVNPPTAWRMLHDFVELKAGDWVIQNAANSGVGRAAIKICKSLGIRTVNVVRREELVSELEEEGGDVVLIDTENVVQEIKEKVKAGPVKLALNAVGGDSALRLANSLSRTGTHVTFGAMGKKPLRIPNGLLIFKDLRFRGFWITKWFERATPEERTEMFKPLIELVRSGALKIRIAATYSLGQVKQAIEHSSREARGGKVLFRM